MLKNFEFTGASQMTNKPEQLTDESINLSIGVLELFSLGLKPSYKDLIAGLDSAIVGLRELQIARQRIAELEARKFKVEMPESFYPDGDIDAPLVVDELEVIAAIVEAGGKPVAFCKRCDHELDLTHRPDGTHYCHSKR
jgi:hypothetical protein